MSEVLALDVDRAEQTLIATFLVTLLLGLNVVLCFLCVRILLQRRRAGVQNTSRLICVALFQLGLCVGHAATYLWAAMVAYVRHGAEPNGAALYLRANWAGGAKVAQRFIFAANEVCFDAILVWRCHVVMNSNWRVTGLLGAMTAAVAVAGFGSAIRIWTTPRGAPPSAADLHALFVWLTTFETSSAAVQAVSSALIAGKVWAVLASRAERRPGMEWAAVRIGVEAGALRTLCSFALIPIIWSGSMVGVVVAGIACQLDATAPALIIIRTEALRTAGTPGHDTSFLSDDVSAESLQMPSIAKNRNSNQLRRRSGDAGSVQA